MVLRLNIDQIELATRDWICKVQIVEMGRPRESPDKKCRFQNLILEYEEKYQIKAVMYADEIEQYADKLKLINTHLISTTRVKKNQFLLTLWEDFGEIEGHEIVSKMATEADLIVILERSTRISTFQEKTSTSSSVTPMIVTPTGQQFISVAEISSAPSDANRRSAQRIERILNVQNAIGKTTLVPRCIFQIDLIDGIATTTASISAELGEKLLSMTAEDIFDITCTKRQSLSLDNVHQMLSNKVFQLELRKSSWGSSNSTHATLSILSYMEKEHTPQSTTDRNSKKIRPLEISEVDVIATTTAAGSSNATPTFEPPTPTKKV
ncbi:hypothetical protein H5410_044599 [Solanum commersonii]|uniref:Uncharacterized protein n=1 Tax=Solanum commersonii TaxID=4109 RepID=A0A9J5X9H0_SOLCO|nr:hypothetical protein H5410_044599 [Solanum commersonii]